MIHYTSEPFDFTELSLSKPIALQGGTFFSKIQKKSDPLYIYSPRCHTSGIVASGSKQYADLVFTNDVPFVHWMESLEERVQALIFENRHTWFATESIDLDDIQHAFMPILKFKQSQYTLRGNILIRKHPWEESLQVYNERECLLPQTSVKDSNVISILDIHGLKFNDKSFQVVVYLRQLVVLTPSLFSECKIKLKEEVPIDISESILSIKEVPNPE
jgi:hypothetical protein